MLGIITYDTPHLKTEHLVFGLLERGEGIGTLYGLPFVFRPGREVVFNHRPSQGGGQHPRDIARKHGIKYVVVESTATLAIDESLALISIGEIGRAHV